MVADRLGISRWRCDRGMLAGERVLAMDEPRADVPVGCRVDCVVISTAGLDHSEGTTPRLNAQSLDVRQIEAEREEARRKAKGD